MAVVRAQACPFSEMLLAALVVVKVVGKVKDKALPVVNRQQAVQPADNLRLMQVRVRLPLLTWRQR
jgi:hypothetical protein